MPKLSSWRSSQFSRRAKQVKMPKEQVKSKKAKVKSRKEEGSDTQATRLSSPPSSFLFTFYFLLASAGCNGLNQTTAGPDPLLGGPALKGSAQAKQAPANPTAVLPPWLAPSSATSNAALAAGVPLRAPDKDHDLRIGPAQGSGGSDGWAKQASATAADRAGAVLRPPEPIVEPAPRQEPNPGYKPVPPATSRLSTVEEAKAQLAARGATYQKLEPVAETGEWKFICFVPNRQNPKIHRTHEARARDPLAAMQAVLEQIDKEQ